MSTKALIPGNSQRARSTALNAFERFAATEQLTVKRICEYVGSDSSGEMLYIVLNKFAIYLAFRETSKGSLLSKNSVASYFGNVKNHLLEMFPALGAASGRRLQKIASILDKYCSKRDTEFTRQAPPCTKNDLDALATTMMKRATHADDYKDVALLNLLWHLLGRSSDTVCLLKNQIAVYPGGCLYINFKCMKSAASQGASLFHDRGNFSSCPIHSLAVATIMQSTPSEFLLDQLPRNTMEADQVKKSEISLLDLLETPPDTSSEFVDPPRKPTRAAVPGIHAYVNRILQKWSSICANDGLTLTSGLSSHSFRRGAAQSANGNCHISTPCILDRGGWSLTAVSKAFNYIVSTTHEDQAVGKTHAGWNLKDVACLPSFEGLDSLFLHRVRLLQSGLFAIAQGFSESLSLREDVLEVFAAAVIVNYPEILRAALGFPYIQRVQQILDQLRISESEITAWSLTIYKSFVIHDASTEPGRTPTDPTNSDHSAELVRKQTLLVEQQTRVVEALAKQVELLSARVRHLEDSRAGSNPPVPASDIAATAATLATTEPTRARRNSAKSLTSVWFEWFCNIQPFSHENRRRYHEMKVVVAFMRIFLPNGYDAIQEPCHSRRPRSSTAAAVGHGGHHLPRVTAAVHAAANALLLLRLLATEAITSPGSQPPSTLCCCASQTRRVQFDLFV